MKKNSLNFTVDLIGFLNLLALIVTGFILKYVLPPGSGGLGRAAHDGRGRADIKTLLSMDRHDWGGIHFYLAILFIALMFFHITLHWKWIKNYCKSHITAKIEN